MLLPDDALLLFKDKQFAENVVGHDNDDLAEVSPKMEYAAANLPALCGKG